MNPISPLIESGLVYTDNVFLFHCVSQVDALNFNPFFRNKGDNDHFYIAKHNCSEITEFSFPEETLRGGTETSQSALKRTLHSFDVLFSMFHGYCHQV